MFKKILGNEVNSTSKEKNFICSNTNTVNSIGNIFDEQINNHDNNLFNIIRNSIEKKTIFESLSMKNQQEKEKEKEKNDIFLFNYFSQTPAYMKDNFVSSYDSLNFQQNSKSKNL